MNQALICPNCGAALDYSGQGSTTKCPYCGTIVQVPQELWAKAREAQSANTWLKYLAIFLLITVGLPTCLGLLATLLGVGGGFLAAILPFILRVFAR